MRATVPEPRGHIPIATTDLDYILPGDLALDDEGHIWSLANNLFTESQRLHRLGSNGQAVSVTGPTFEGQLKDLQLHTDGSSFIMVNERERYVYYLSDEGTLVWERTFVQAPAAHNLLLGMSPAWDGHATWGGDDDTTFPLFVVAADQGVDIGHTNTVVALDGDGSSRSLGAFPVPETEDRQPVYALDSWGRLWLASTENDAEGPAHISVHEPGSSSGPVFEQTIAGNTGGGAILEMRADATGGMYVAGFLRTDSIPGGSGVR